MPKTYYDSELTGAQIEDALTAIDGVVIPGNNGKVLYIENGQIKAASASRWSGGAVLEPLSVTSNGDYTPPTGTDGFDSVHVAVPSATLTTKSITQNGTYNASQDNADGYSSVTVNVSGGGSAVVQPLSVTQNGTYNPPSGIDGYAPVTVNVSGGGEDPFAGITDYIECSGTQYIDTGYVVNDNTEVECIVNFKDIVSNAETVPFGSRMATDYNTPYSSALPFYCEASMVYQSAISNISYTVFPATGFRVIEANANFYGSGRPLTIKVYNHDIKVKITASTSEFKIETDEGDRFTQELVSLGSLNANTAHLILFGLNTNGNVFISAKFALYCCRIRENGTLLHEFLPHKDGNNVVCLRDTVTGNLFYNAGTGDFVYGTDT